jgi:hypothetical protein
MVIIPINMVGQTSKQSKAIGAMNHDFLFSFLTGAMSNDC